MNARTFFPFAILFLIPLFLQAQIFKVHEYSPNTDSTVYNVINKIFDANTPLSYLAAHPVHRYELPHLNPLLPLEGERMRAEANLDFSFVLRRGRDYSNNFGQSARLTFDYLGQIRIAKDSSSPIMPPTNGFGIGVDWAFWDNFRDRSTFGNCNENGKSLTSCNFDSRNFWLHCDTAHVAYTMWYVSLKAMHYSNGQGPGFYVKDNPSIRHDYISGDFSTNYLRALFWYNRMNRTNQLISAAIGIQQEVGDDGGFLKFSEEQEDSYGRTRLLANFQIRSRPLRFNTKKKPSKNCDTCDKYKLNELFELRFRTEMSFILDDVSNWRLGNYNEPARFGMHAYAELNPLRMRSLGLLLHYYYGRDYHNIRYDNVVHIFQVGISLKFNKYKPFMENFDVIGREPLN